jgi:sugar (pentulose or hexulose) kinase
MRGILTIDAGTTSIRTILFDEGGHAVSVAQRENPPIHYPDGRVEQSPETWSKLLVELLALSAASARGLGIELACISLTSQRSSVIPVDRDGLPLHPAIMWQDRRTAELCRELESEAPSVYRKSGNTISPVFSAIKMTWFRKTMPSLFERTHKMLGIHDYLLHVMTGEFRTDRSLASRTNLLDLESRDWDDGLIELFGVERRQLCELIEPGSRAGSLLPSIASSAGLAAGLPVISAGGDQQCAALGMGLLSAGRMIANTGTGSYLIGHADRPALDPEMRVSCNVSALPGAYIVEAGILASGAIYSWLDDLFFDAARDAARDDAGDGRRFARINAEAASAPPGSNGVLLMPHFKGAGSPHWNPRAKGFFYGLSLGTTRGELARAILEGIAAELADSMELIEALAGVAAEVSVAGGLTNNPLYNGIQADMYGKGVLRSTEGEATARGAWIAAAVALGVHATHREAFEAVATRPEITLPNEANAAIYARLREKRRRLYAALDAGGVFDLD